MKNTFLLALNGILLIVDLVILYFWIINWKGLYSTYGLIVWLGSIVLGLLIYKVYSPLSAFEKVYLISKRTGLVSSIFTLCLAVIAVVINFIVKSMP